MRLHTDIYIEVYKLPYNCSMFEILYSQIVNNPNTYSLKISMKYRELYKKIEEKYKTDEKDRVMGLILSSLSSLDHQRKRIKKL